MTLLEEVVSTLRRHGLGHALIGAAALAAHGISRSTLDQDVLVVDARALEAERWGDLSDTSVDIRRGDAEDPLTGVIRLRKAGQRDVDVIVGRGGWQEDVIARAEPIRIGSVDVPVVTAADLVLLKLYAGGSQDKWDIEQLLAADTSGALREDVDRLVTVLPRRCRELWTASFARPATS